jgi:hypothetical protein
MTLMPTLFPIYRVRESGAVDRLGEWVHAERRLVLELPGFPFLAPGEHRLESDLPWVFWDMCPAGYLGRQYQRRLPDLALGPDPTRWSADEVLRALSTHGHELSGNLIVGDKSLEQFRAWRFDGRQAPEQLDALLREAFVPGAESSLGGERPKLVASSADGAGYLMKFSPPPTSPQGVRWGDLLRVEDHCTKVLSFFGISAVRATAGTTHGRTTLHVRRFDRLQNRGRVGAATLYWYAMDALGDVAIAAPRVVQTLVEAGHLSAEAADVCALVHAFSAAIGNTDAHLGNYGLLFDEDGRSSLAPIYDVLPMVLAPRHDELPDLHLTVRTLPVDRRVSAWVEELVVRVERDPGVTGGFKDVWRRYLGV